MNESSITCGALRILFRKQHDRYAHAIECLVADQWLVVVTSIEGTPDDDWPPSSPLQSLHIEQRPNGPVALLVGMAGTSHWSASVEADEATQSIVFDIACRVRGEPVRLGSTYEWRADDDSMLALPNLIIDQDTARIENNGSLTSVMPIYDVSAGAVTVTVRWRYRFKRST